VLKPKEPRLTEAERAALQAALRLSLSREQSLDKSEAITALEHAARLLDDGDGMRFPANLREELLPVVEQASGLVIRDTGLMETSTIAEGKPARAVPLVLGVSLNVSLDFKLLSVTLSPDELQEWKKWMRVVGIAGDVELSIDVAENHDHYLTEPV
jgi:hypothetical protein